MSLLKIARMGHPVLRATAEPVRDPTDPEVWRLASDMVETMLDASGAGLAAPQVYASVRVIAVRSAESAGSGGVPVVLINPAIEPVGEEIELAFEGCLSIPELRGIVPRYARIRWSALGLDGRPLKGEAEGFAARVIQHEVDHLDGILYIDRMTDLRLLGFVGEVHHITEALKDAGEE